MTAPRRSWLFSLRTLFVAVGMLSLPLGWFAWQARLVSERQLVLSRMAHCGGGPDSSTAGLSWAWRLLGATSVINLDTGSVTTKVEIDRLHLLFPETENVQGQWQYFRDELD